MYVCTHVYVGGVDRGNSSEVHGRDGGQNSATHGRDGKQWKPCWTVLLSSAVTGIHTDWAFLQPHGGSTDCGQRFL
jgi:hypothetical protein